MRKLYNHLLCEKYHGVTRGKIMGGMWFDPKTLADSLSETAGYKAGLALSLEHMCDLLKDTSYPDTLVESETTIVRIRSEDYEDLFYKLLHRIGFTEEEHQGISGAKLFHKYRRTNREKIFTGITELLTKFWPKLLEEAQRNGNKSIDPMPYLEACKKGYGKIGVELAIERLEHFNTALSLNPHFGKKYTEWSNIEDLENLFSGSNISPEYGEFLDQRFINYLAKNPDKIGKMHWRKFEELSAEYFDRHGYKVELGPGRNDDGVDVRVWDETDNEDTISPRYIIQCKRHKNKIDKVTIKGLYADTMFEKAECGLLVTSSELSTGARNTISVRGYPIEEVNHSKLTLWLNELKTPGTGIVRV